MTHLHVQRYENTAFMGSKYTNIKKAIYKNIDPAVYVSKWLNFVVIGCCGCL